MFFHRIFLTPKDDTAHSVLVKCTCTALLAALGVALAYFPHMFSGTTFRVDLAVLSVLMAANFFGPLYSGACAVIIDLLSCLSVGDAVFLPITVCKLVTGLILGYSFYNRRFGVVRTVVTFFAVGVISDFALMSVALRLLVPTYRWEALLPVRALTAGINFAVRLIFAFAVCTPLRKPLLRMIGNAGVRF